MIENRRRLFIAGALTLGILAWLAASIAAAVRYSERPDPCAEAP